MPIVVKSQEINKDIEKFCKLFYYMQEQGIEYNLHIETIDSMNTFLKKNLAKEKIGSLEV